MPWEANRSIVTFHPKGSLIHICGPVVVYSSVWLTALCIRASGPGSQRSCGHHWMDACFDVSASLLKLRLSITPVTQRCLTWQNLTWLCSFDMNICYRFLTRYSDRVQIFFLGNVKTFCVIVLWDETPSQCCPIYCDFSMINNTSHTKFRIVLRGHILFYIDLDMC